MFAWFERRIDPYPDQTPTMPPSGLWRFVLHYSRGTLPWLVLLAVGSGLIALIEVALFGWLGQLIDQLADTPREVFWDRHGGSIALMALVLLVVMPALNVVTSLVLHQSLMGNFPQRIRWQAHRWLLRQSVGYFQDEFAGRIAQRLMQTALAVREVSMKIMDVGSYVLIYFLGAMVLAASQDWRLALPFLVWAAAYGALLWYVVPRLGRVAQEQADARSAMTGRIVDSYTNIATVKLFSHSDREEAWMHQGMDRFLGTVHAQMRLSSLQDMVLNLLNVWLVAAVAGLGLWLWTQGLIAVGAVAIAVPLALRLNNMSHWIMWEFAALFENIGTVRDGITSLSLPREVRDAPGAQPLLPGPAAVRFDNVTFRYGGAGRPDAASAAR